MTNSHGEKDAAWYDQSFLSSDHWRQHYTLSRYYFLWCVIVDRIRHEKIPSILEVGCGAGQLARFLCDIGVKHYKGFDFSPKRIECAQSICPEFTFKVEDAFQTDLFTEFDYEAVILTEFLEHIERDIDILKRIKTGKRVFGTVPNFPYESHVRHFQSPQQVVSRYRALFTQLRIDPFMANPNGAFYFLIDGIRA
jgi:SAM-dependent methyltransferase